LSGFEIGKAVNPRKGEMDNLSGRLFKPTRFRVRLDLGGYKDVNLKDDYLNFDYLEMVPAKESINSRNLSV